MEYIFVVLPSSFFLLVSLSLVEALAIVCVGEISTANAGFPEGLLMVAI